MGTGADNEMDQIGARVSRRTLFTGAGVAGAALLTVGVAGSSPAEAAPVAGDGVAHANAAMGQPISSSIGSAPLSGYTYRSACMYDFRPFYPAAALTWGGNGVYSAGTASPLRATFEIPPGALAADIEWYVYNNSGSAVLGSLYQYAPGTGSISSLNADVSIASTATVTAGRAAVPAGTAGPFSVVAVSLKNLSTPTDATVQVNGVRIGFTRALAASGLLPTPVRAYDSRVSGGKLAAGSTRTITLPSSIVVPGVSGVLANITVTSGTGVGYLKVFPANAALPAASTINYTKNQIIANAIDVGVSAAGQIKVFASTAVHVVVDITGTLS